MTKYENSNVIMSRTKRNSEVYSSLDLGDLSRVKTNNNVSVISEAPKQIDIEKIKKYIYAKNEEENERKSRVTLDLPEEKSTQVERQEPKDYDINSVLEHAKESKETDYENIRYRKFNDKEYDILRKIKLATEHEEKDPDITEPINELNTQEKTIVDLINDISKTKVSKKEDLFSDLMSDNENTVVMAPITDEINKENISKELDEMTRQLDELRRPLDDLTQDLLLEKEKLKVQSGGDEPIIEKIDVPTENTEKMSNIDKSFFTNSLSFSKTDFDSDEDNEEEGSKKGEFYAKFAIVMIILVLIATAVIVLNYVLDLKWF